MSLTKVALALVGVALVWLVFPDSAHAWTPGTHIYLGETVLANLPLLPAAVADLLRAYPFDFLYGNIAADSSIAKHYAPLGRHCHYWHVGQEIHDLADSDAVRAFGLGYLCHLSADTVAHNYFVPRQLMLTSSTAAVGHSYWETRVETHLGDAYSKSAKDVILLDHGEADAHLDRIIAPTIFSVRTNRRLFRGMVHLTETTSWQRATQVAREYSRWRLDDADVERHLGLSYDYMIELLGGETATAHQLDPSGERPLKSAKQLRRRVLRETGRRNTERLRTEAMEQFGLPTRPLTFWTRIAERLPWGAPEGAAPSPKALVNGRRR
ncbi:MAG TPA: zinc dependent phospholipase C family protein [Gemmatimonadales bacterium]|nr:zinc dependent phospholipase C family protein [Gemmatimonadales bacterium]